MLLIVFFSPWTYHKFNPKLLTSRLIFPVVQMHHFISGTNYLPEPLDWCPLHILYSSHPRISYYYSRNSLSLFYIGSPVSWIPYLPLGHSITVSFGLFFHFGAASLAKSSLLGKDEYEIKQSKSNKNKKQTNKKNNRSLILLQMSLIYPHTWMMVLVSEVISLQNLGSIVALFPIFNISSISFFFSPNIS